MTKVTDTGTFSLLAGDDGVDPIEDRSRANARGTIEAVFNEELDSFLGRLRHGRKTGAVKGYRHGSRDHRITGTFGTETISVPRARIRPNSRWSVPRWRPRRRAISVTDKPISIMPVKRHRSSSVKWLYLVAIAIPGLPGVALGVGIWVFFQSLPLRHKPTLTN